MSKANQRKKKLESNVNVVCVCVCVWVGRVRNFTKSDESVGTLVDHQ